MKRRRICISGAVLAVALAGCLFPAFAFCSTATRTLGPAGMNIIGAVQFDAVIELNRYSARTLRHDYTVIFARYWVARDYYSVAVVWAEPQSMDMFLAVRPPLAVASNQQSFNVRQESTKKENQTFAKPLGERGVFRYEFGSYPFDNIRFAEAEAFRTRVYARDIGGLNDANQSYEGSFDVSLPADDARGTRDVAKLKVQAGGGRIDSMELFDAKEQLLKSISYEYQNTGNHGCLQKLRAVLPQRPMMVGFNSGGMKVTLDGKEYRYKDLEATHHAGGRRCTVEYESVTLGDKKVQLPVQVIVWGGKDDKVLRSVHLMNFKRVELDAAGVEHAARQFAAVPPDERQYEQLRLKYWKKAPAETEQEDIAAIRQLLAHFQDDASSASQDTGEKLRRLNILMELSLMLGDVPELTRHYQRYLSTLQENQLAQMTLVGGYGVIENSMFRGRRTEAEKLLSLWVKAVVDMHADDSILLFARRQLAKSRLWPTAALLEAFCRNNDRPAGARFEAEALRCTALAQLRTLLQTQDISKKGLMAEVEANWAASIGKDGLDRMLAESVARAKQSFAKLPAPTESQQALTAQLDKIDKEIGQVKNQ